MPELLVVGERRNQRGHTKALKEQKKTKLTLCTWVFKYIEVSQPKSLSLYLQQQA
jgi:hypothetical protein